MSVTRVQNLRRSSILSVIASVAILFLSGSLPKLWVAILLLVSLSIPFILWDHVWPRRTRKLQTRDFVPIESAEAVIRLQLALGEISRTQFDEKMAQVQQKPPSIESAR